jgi:hypothetical protein
MSGMPRTQINRYWPLAVLVLVVISLFVFRIDRRSFNLNLTDTVYFCGNNLILLGSPAYRPRRVFASFSPSPMPVVIFGHTIVTNSGNLFTPDMAIIPLWPAQAPLLIVALWVIVRRRRAQLVESPGDCPCGYNLHGNVSGICPECGMVVADTHS